MNTQLELSLIPHQIDNSLILQRAIDGYVNATAMCQAVGKSYNDYGRLSVTQGFVTELASETGIPVSELIVVKKGGVPGEQGTWVHPDVAINLGQWCSPKFAVAVTRWVREWHSGKSKAVLPYHIERYMMNMGAIPVNHFSILNELTFGLVGPLEARGYVLPENMVPDISEGRMFCKWLREKKGLDTDSLPKYNHRYPDGRVVQAKLYPLWLLEDFRRHFHGVWIPTRSEAYFQERDPAALPFLRDVIINLPQAVQTIEVKEAS